MDDPLATIKIAPPKIASPCTVPRAGARLRAARSRRMVAFASALVVMLAVEIWAQSFGLRALSAALSGSAKTATPHQDEIERAPAVHAPCPDDTVRW